jgi:ornithine--oxo-acid transaminase
MIWPDEVQEFLDAFADVMKDAERPNGLAWEFGKTLAKQALARS